MKPTSDSLNILVQVDLRQKAARDLLGGVLHAAAQRPRWNVRLLRGHPLNRLADLAQGRPDGLITDRPLSPQQTRSLADAGLRTLIAAYDNESGDPNDPRLAVRHVCCDNAAIGRTAAELLLSKRLRHFAYVPATIRNAFLRMRCAAFRDTLSAHGLDAHVYDPPRRSKGNLAYWLENLPKPCGIFTEFDQRAKDVIDTCRTAGLKIPEQLLLVGVDNEEYICENTIPTLTSVWPDFNRGGHLAIETMERLLRGEHVAREPIRYGVRDVVARVSTADVTGTARTVALAVEHIRRHAAEPIRIADIAYAACTSERLLELHFRDVLGTTAAKTLQRTRLDLVKELLRTGDLPLARLGERCGFNSEAHLKTLFKRETGMTMSDYRRRASKPGQMAYV